MSRGKQAEADPAEEEEEARVNTDRTGQRNQITSRPAATDNKVTRLHVNTVDTTTAMGQIDAQPWARSAENAAKEGTLRKSAKREHSPKLDT